VTPTENAPKLNPKYNACYKYRNYRPNLEMHLDVTDLEIV